MRTNIYLRNGENLFQPHDCGNRLSGGGGDAYGYVANGQHHPAYLWVWGSAVQAIEDKNFGLISG
jgi:hypothetical protein